MVNDTPPIPSRNPRLSPAGGAAGEGLDLSALRPGEVTDYVLRRLLRVIVGSFGEWPAFDPGVPPAEHLRWKMDSPVGELAAIVGELAGEPACCQICVTQHIQIGRQVRPRVRSADFAVLPEFRGRGFASAMSEFKAKACGPLIVRITETRHPAILRLARRSGGRPLGNPVRPLVAPCATGELIRRLHAEGKPASTAAIAGLTLAAVSRLQRAAVRAPRQAAGEPKTLERFDARAADLWEHARSAFDVIVVRTPEYLNWRYCDPRGGRWRVQGLVESETGRLSGYTAWKVEGGRGLIGDLLALPGRLDVVTALVTRALREVRAAGAASVLCWLPARHPYRGVLRRLGFVDSPTRVGHLFRGQSLTSELVALLSSRHARAHFTLGDSDFV